MSTIKARLANIRPGQKTRKASKITQRSMLNFISHLANAKGDHCPEWPKEQTAANETANMNRTVAPRSFPPCRLTLPKQTLESIWTKARGPTHPTSTYTPQRNRCVFTKRYRLDCSHSVCSRTEWRANCNVFVLEMPQDNGKEWLTITSRYRCIYRHHTGWKNP